jgi:tetratricopeptide (TPR) repeat protein
MVTLPEGEPDLEALRAFIGYRTVLLAPLFGLCLIELRVRSSGDVRIVVAHDGIEEVVALKQLRRFLRQRVVELLQGDGGRGHVAIDLAQADLARSALDQGRPEEAVARLISWLAPLSVFHRTAEGQAVDSATRARLARALGTLAEAYSQLHRLDERNEVLRLALQYALDGEAAPELYLALARAMLEEKREPEAIAPLRRALALGADALQVLPLLGVALAHAGRWVAALGCARALRSKGVADAALEQLVRDALGSALDDYESWVEHGQLAEKTETMPALVLNRASERSDEGSMGDATIADVGDADTTPITLAPSMTEDTAIDRCIAAKEDDSNDSSGQ